MANPPAGCCKAMIKHRTVSHSNWFPPEVPAVWLPVVGSVGAVAWVALQLGLMTGCDFRFGARTGVRCLERFYISSLALFLSWSPHGHVCNSVACSIERRISYLYNYERMHLRNYYSSPRGGARIPEEHPPSLSRCYRER